MKLTRDHKLTPHISPTVYRWEFTKDDLVEAMKHFLISKGVKFPEGETNGEVYFGGHYEPVGFYWVKCHSTTTSQSD